MIDKRKNKANVPNLRFPGFEGGWVEKKLGEICEVIGGGTPETNKNEYWNGNIQWFTPTEIKTRFVSKSERTISELGLKKSSAKILPKGTILLTTRATIGEASIALEECTTNQGFQSLVVDKGYNNIFIYNWIKENKYELIKRSNGSTFPEISKSEIEKIEINLPSIDEQKKISSFLSLLDNRIQTQIKIIEELESLSKGLREKLFSQQLRFKDDKGNEFPDWEEKILGNLVEFKNGKAHENDIDENGKYIVVNSKFISRVGDVKKYSNECIMPLYKDEIVMVMSDVPNGKALAKCFLIDENNKYTLNQRICGLKAFNCYNPFLYFMLNRNEYYLSFDSGVGQTNLRKEEVLKCPLIIPSSVQEQIKIAKLLLSIDQKINISIKIFESLVKQKKYFLQQMFI
ncbi:restriction endonuclease subunit S [Ferruginibacter sp. SUN002]|uniref:restriction endonuclease subunit S n=1 Tax=Ferruginibacter sp. SUN002 TaxID=2937789 RepID=UPI003D3687C3